MTFVASFAREKTGQYFNFISLMYVCSMLLSVFLYVVFVTKLMIGSVGGWE